MTSAGINTHGLNSGPELGYARVDLACDWLRVPLYWDEDNAPVLETIRRAKRLGFRVNAVLAGRKPPESLALWGAWVEQTCREIRAHAYGVWNEPDDPAHWGAEVDIPAYRALALVTARRIKRVQRRAPIWGPELSPTGWLGDGRALPNWIQHWEPIPGLTHISLHVYGVRFDEMLAKIRWVEDVTGLPVVVTEYGSHDPATRDGYAEALSGRLAILYKLRAGGPPDEAAYGVISGVTVTPNTVSASEESGR
jgi:hypothetical protein